jgi:hypothetical protein
LFWEIGRRGGVTYREEEIAGGRGAGSAISSSEARVGEKGVVFAIVALLLMASVVVVEGV